MPEIYRKARPRELKTPLLNNPHKGCATFQGFAGDLLFPGEWWSEEGPLAFPAAEFDVAPHYLPSTVAYCRWFWEKIEPIEGELNFAMIEGALNTASARHQTLQVRLMGHGVDMQPRLPVWYREKYPTRKFADHQWNYLEAEHDAPEYLAKWGRVIQAFGQRFNGHAALESVDIAFIGRWGEGLGDCSEATSLKFIELYEKALPDTALLINCEGISFPQGIQRGHGWRADAFGDLRRNSTPEIPPHLGWNHTYDMYPRWISVHGAGESWKKHPVTLETYSAPLEMCRQGYDLELILEQGLKYHASIFCPKSTPLPDEWKPRLAEFCDRLGYRLVFRQARWSATAEKGQPWEYQVWIENTGVAPLYRQYTPAFRLQGDRGEAIYELKDDPRTWLPGDAWLEGTLQRTDSLGAGKALLSFGLIDPRTKKPAVRFAVEETDKDGWVPLDVVALA